MDYKRTQIPKRFWEKTLSDYKVGREQGSREGLDAAAAYVDMVEQHRDDGTGLTFVGPPGVGKTMLLCLVGQAIADKGYKVVFMPLAKYVRIQLNLIAWGRDDVDDEAAMDWCTLRKLSLKYRNTIDFLLLDDVGKEHRTESHYAEDEFDYLVRSRYDNSLPTLMTSNLKVHRWGTPEDGSKGVYGTSMESFIYEAAPPVEMDVRDFRR